MGECIFSVTHLPCPVLVELGEGASARRGGCSRWAREDGKRILHRRGRRTGSSVHRGHRDGGRGPCWRRGSIPRILGCCIAVVLPGTHADQTLPLTICSCLPVIRNWRAAPPPYGTHYDCKNDTHKQPQPPLLVQGGGWFGADFGSASVPTGAAMNFVCACDFALPNASCQEKGQKKCQKHKKMHAEDFKKIAP